MGVLGLVLVLEEAGGFFRVLGTQGLADMLEGLVGRLVGDTG